MKFTTRKEQRKVTEVVSAILLPLLPHLKEDEADAVRTAIMILQKTEIEGEDEVDKIVSKAKEKARERIKLIDTLDKIKAEILDEAEYAYADFDKYKEDILHAESDELPDDDFRYGLERGVEIINKYRLPSVIPSYNSVKTDLNHTLDKIITQIEEVRDKDKIAEYPYNRCISIIKKEMGINERDCENCKHYVLHDKTVNLPPIYACEEWECEFKPKGCEI
jgi:hypothetical protein